MSKKIDKLLDRINSDKALHMIGLRLVSRIKMNVTAQRIIDHGLLRKRIAYRVDGNELTVGSGAAYSKFHEFGTRPSRKMARWIFANLIKKDKKRRSKNVIIWSGSGKNIEARIKARPFFWPAIEAERKNIAEILRTFYLGQK